VVEISNMFSINGKVAFRVDNNPSAFIRKECEEDVDGRAYGLR
jgi:hypothetical protein